MAAGNQLLKVTSRRAIICTDDFAKRVKAKGMNISLDSENGARHPNQYAIKSRRIAFWICAHLVGCLGRLDMLLDHGKGSGAPAVQEVDVAPDAIIGVIAFLQCEQFLSVHHQSPMRDIQ